MLSTPNYLLRQDLGGHIPTAPGTSLLNLLHLSDAHVIDTVSPARCEWVQLLAHDPRWQPLLPMHRPYEALTHWALAAHVQALHQVAQHLAAADDCLAQQAAHLDLMAEELRLAQQALGAITGEFSADDLLGEIFSRFCIGK